MTPERLEEIKAHGSAVRDVKTAPFHRAIEDLLAYVKELEAEFGNTYRQGLRDAIRICTQKVAKESNYEKSEAAMECAEAIQRSLFEKSEPGKSIQRIVDQMKSIKTFESNARVKASEEAAGICDKYAADIRGQQGELAAKNLPSWANEFERIASAVEDCAKAIRKAARSGNA